MANKAAPNLGGWLGALTNNLKDKEAAAVNIPAPNVQNALGLGVQTTTANAPQKAAATTTTLLSTSSGKQSAAASSASSAATSSASATVPNSSTSSAATATGTALPATLLTAPTNSTKEWPNAEYVSFDGFYHNVAEIEWGVKDKPLHRRVPSAYTDGVLEFAGFGRPQPRDLSNALMDGPTGRPSINGRTALVVYFGQQVVEEILDAQANHCPREYVNIPLNGSDVLYGNNPGIPFLRARYDTKTGNGPNNPREHFNLITPWIDGGLMYGTEKAWSDVLRSFSGGQLAENAPIRESLTEYYTQKYPTKFANGNVGNIASFPQNNAVGLPMANPPPPRDHQLKMSTRLHTLGNPRGNENPWLYSMGVLWFREHNYQAQRLQALHPDWTDEVLFFEARKWTIAIHQRVVTRDWLPAFLGKPFGQALAPYTGYDPGVYPQISHIFQSAAMRWGHTIVTPGVYRRDMNCNFYTTTNVTAGGDPSRVGLPAVRTCNAFWEPNEATAEFGVGAIFMGMASQVGEREDNIITPDLRGFVFGPLEFSRRDLMAINIQRGRDHGLPDYNTARFHMGLPKQTKFDDITGDWDVPAAAPLYTAAGEVITKDHAQRIYNLYNPNNDSSIDAINNIDVWVGGLLETSGGNPGQLFTAVLTDQFTRIRDGDRFWYANNISGPFINDEIAFIESDANNLQALLLRNNADIEALNDNGPFDNGKGVPHGLQADPWHIPNFDAATAKSTNPNFCQQPQQISAEILEPCTNLETYDYFYTSIWQIPGLLIMLALVQIFANLLAMYIVRVFEARRAKIKLADQSKKPYKPSIMADLTSSVPSIWNNDGRVLYTVNSFAGSVLDSKAAGAKVLKSVRPDSAVPESGTQAFLELDLNTESLHVLVYPEGLNPVRTVKFESITEIFVGGNADGFMQDRFGRDKGGKNAFSFDQPPPVIARKTFFGNGRKTQAGGRTNMSRGTLANFATTMFQGINAADTQLEVLLKIPDLYDVWVVFQDVHSQETFVNSLLDHLPKSSTVEPQEVLHRQIVENSKIRAERAAEVELFMREALNRAFGEIKGEDEETHAPKKESFRMKLFHSRMKQQKQRAPAEVDTGLLRAEAMPSRHQIMNMTLAREELAEHLGLALDSAFVRQIFRGNKHGGSGLDSVSFQDVLNVLLILSNGSESEKLELMFDLYDLDGSGTIDREEIRAMLKSLVSGVPSLAGMGDAQIENIVNSWIESSASKESLDFDDFKNLLGGFDGVLTNLKVSGRSIDVKPTTAELFNPHDSAAISGTGGVRRGRTVRVGEEYAGGAKTSSKSLSRVQTHFGSRKAKSTIGYSNGVLPPVRYIGWFERMRGEYADNRMRFVFVFFFIMICLLSFTERAYIFLTHREHGGLRSITNFGVAVTRGAAQVQLVAYAAVLLSMCRNSITYLRSTWFGRAFPLQYYREFHQIAAWTGLFFSVVHSVGHIVNFYNISTQPVDDMLCYFRDTYNYSWELVSFYRWLYITPTGLSGVFLVTQLVFITIFASKYIRRYAYEAFWFFHSTHPYFFVLMIVHGALQLVQHPLYWWWLLGPTLLYRLDSAIASKQLAIKFKLLRMDALPSGVVRLVFLKPHGFANVPGQWARIALPDIARKEFHPFTISSAPSMPIVTFHILALGDWTSKLRDLCLSVNAEQKVLVAPPHSLDKDDAKYLNRSAPALPEVRVEGPFDQVIANYDRYPVSIFVGAGIGVTPFTSMLLEIKHAMETDPTKLGKLRKVYFFWVTRSQRSYEWMVDLIAELENSPLGEILECHVFITEVPSKFDLRTMLLYVTERQFHKFHNKSLFTGLSSQTHFGRPDWVELFGQIQAAHDPARGDLGDDVPASKIGVFTCGPGPLCHGVSSSVRTTNLRAGPRFSSFYDLFG